MSFFSNLKADRLITEFRAASSPGASAAKKALLKLNKMGSGAIPKTIEALGQADKNQTLALVELLTGLVNTKSFNLFSVGLSDSNPRTVAGVSWALSSSKQYSPSRLLELLNDPDVSKSAVLEVLVAHKERLNVRDLLTHAYNQEPNEKAALFKIIGEISDEQIVPDLISRMEGKDPIARVHIINILARFDLPIVHNALQKQLKDNNKMVRLAALTALAKMSATVSVELLCSLLSDAEIDVQNKAVDIVIQLNHPDTVRYLIEPLKDESEYSRRAAVEVLNEIGDSNSVKHLLQAVEDEDWWVRARAADALAKIGGPRVLNAVLQLIKDDDESIRRAAVEILNSVKDESAIKHLIEATEDADWWVSERAVDALAEIGSKKAVPRLVEMLKKADRSAPVVIRALSKLGDHKVIEPILNQLSGAEKPVKIEAIRALAMLADDRRVDTIRHYINAESQSPDETINQVVSQALKDLDDRFSETVIRASELAKNLAAPPAKTLLIETEDVDTLIEQQEAVPTGGPLDISTLEPGDVLEGRYKYIQKIGKGAFGTVLLMEDTVVDERLILKFLNPNVASDAEMMKRFVHELRYSRKITHKNVIRIYDFLRMGGHYAISMEYFPSHTLANELVNDKPLDLKKASQFTIDIATGMTVAHQVGIVHRDLKPANILINEEGLLKIVDFGVAAAHSSGDTQLTKTGYVIGSPKYMAPEQILGKKVDIRADIYSTGVMFYEMLTGVPPYTRGDHMSVMYQHVQGKYRPAHEINTDLPLELSNIVTTTMQVDQTKRYQSMVELRDAVLPFVQ